MGYYSLWCHEHLTWRSRAHQRDNNSCAKRHRANGSYWTHMHNSSHIESHAHSDLHLRRTNENNSPKCGLWILMYNYQDSTLLLFWAAIIYFNASEWIRFNATIAQFTIAPPKRKAVVDATNQSAYERFCFWQYLLNTLNGILTYLPSQSSW